MKKLAPLFFILLVLSSYSQEQKNYQNLSANAEDYDFHSQVDIGLGIGINYGGLLGAQVQYVPTKHFAIMGSAGYYIAGFG
ncbi:MAG TPA: hypothetical protein QF480_04920 [Bacteroidales bacterium]|jgi:hypothetical protein|nr:hypothetical protein [Bacteroidota bacterium]HJN05935.1 hypothetical protein [Bacteroidales bacterium]|tara:strand:- start:136 stop:378 length:243 start_codon:yes stop_codon:yes gene_type:complete